MALLRQNPLIYPAGFNPGIPSVPAIAGKIIFSGITTSNGGFINLFNGVPGVKNGSPTLAVDGRAGPLVVPAAGTDYYSFTGFPTTDPAIETHACIFTVTNFGGVSAFFSTSSASGGIGLGSYFGIPGLFGWANGAALTSVMPAFSSGVPYFMAASSTSVSNSNVDFVVVRLDTGQTWTETVAGGAANTQVGVGTYWVASSATSGAGGHVGAYFYANIRYTKTELYSLSRNPFQFWFPYSANWIVGSGALPAYVPYDPWPQLGPVLAQ